MVGSPVCGGSSGTCSEGEVFELAFGLVGQRFSFREEVFQALVQEAALGGFGGAGAADDVGRFG